MNDIKKHVIPTRKQYSLKRMNMRNSSQLINYYDPLTEISMNDKKSSHKELLKVHKVTLGIVYNQSHLCVLLSHGFSSPSKRLASSPNSEEKPQENCYTLPETPCKKLINGTKYIYQEYQAIYSMYIVCIQKEW